MSHEKTADFSNRDPLDGIDTLFHHRWSPRSFSSKPVSQSDLQTIFEAARWSPSCYNEQPWRFLTCTQASHHRFLNLLLELNQSWAKSAPVLGFILAEKRFAASDKENAHAMFDTGAAWMSLTLQARMLGLYTHGMAGIHYDRVYQEFDIDPETTKVICGFALGHRGDPEVLPDPWREKEQPTPRKALSDIWISS